MQRLLAWVMENAGLHRNREVEAIGDGGSLRSRVFAGNGREISEIPGL